MVLRARAVVPLPQGQEKENKHEIATFVVPDLTMKDLLAVIPYDLNITSTLTLTDAQALYVEITASNGQL
jgi:hypothetical protein